MLQAKIANQHRDHPASVFLYHMKKLKIWLKAEHGKIVCICLRSRQRCGSRVCDKDEVQYDEYQHLRECFENRKEPDGKGVGD